MSFSLFIDPSFSIRFATALMHFLWQGCLIVLLAHVCELLLRRSAAKWRYAIQVTALFVMAACAPLTYLVLESPTDDARSAIVRSPAVAVPETLLGENDITSDPLATREVGSATLQDIRPPVGHDFGPLTPESPSPSILVVEPQLSGNSVSAADVGVTAVERSLLPSLQSWAPLITVTYFAGFFLLLVRLLYGMWGGHRLRSGASLLTDGSLLAAVHRQSRQLGLRAAPAIAWCERVTVPVVVAVIQPTILLPAAALTGLSPRQLEALILHELVHIRRYDLLVNLLQRVVESMLFFHPAVWCVSRRVSIEREQACDEMVLATGCERTLYADSLVRMAELSASLRGIASPVNSLAASGTTPSEFKRRVLNVMGVQPASNLRPGRWAFVLVVMGALLALSVPAAWLHVDSAANAQTADSGNGRNAKNSDDGSPEDAENQPLPPVGAAEHSKPEMMFKHPGELNRLAWTSDGQKLVGANHVQSSEGAPDARQLYLHWYKTGHLGGGTPPQHLRTIEITAGKDFFIRERGRWIQGRVDVNKSTFRGDVRTFWISRERFRGDFPLDEPLDATIFEWSKGYYPTRVALSRDRSPKAILAGEAERYKAAAVDDRDVRNSANNGLVFAAVDLKRYADHYADSVGASLCNTTHQVYDKPVSDEVNRRNFGLCRQAVQKIVANLETRVDWSLNHPDAENKRKIYVGKPIKARLMLDLPESKSWDEAIEIKLFLEGPPQKNNLMYRDTYPPAKSHLFMEFTIGDLQGGRLGPISGGAMVRSAVYSNAGPPALSEDQERELTLTFQSGYDPGKPRRDGVVLPDDAWGEEVRGLQAALHIPKKVRHSEVVKPLLVVRNTGDKTIRVTWPGYPQGRIRRLGSTLSYGVSHGRSFVERWELKPGQQIKVRMKPVQFLKEGDFGLNAGLKIPAGPQTWSVRIDNRGEHWVWGPQGPDGPSVPFVVPQGEWVGALKAPDRQVELLEEKAKFRVTPPPELPAEHGLPYLDKPPQTVDWSRAESVPLRDGLVLTLNAGADAHWLHDFGRYTTSLYWGPISGDRLLELGLLPLVAESSKRLLREADHESQTDGRIASLVRCSRPLARLGLRLVPLLEERKSPARFPSDRLVRAIRDRRVKLLAMGLEKELEIAIQQLTAHDPPLPAEASFQVIAGKSLPKELKPDAWGPENNGLRAAALMPAEIVDGQTVNVRLFIRNVSDQDIWMAVSDRPGYDYATATDVRGLPLKSTRPLVYPQGFAGGIGPELNPGQTTAFPPLATLTKLVLKAGAVYELKTKTGLRFDSSGKPVAGRFAFGPKQAETAVTVVGSKPTQALLTWRLHTANGAIHDQQLTKRLWPALGGWSGLLTTAPTRVTLKAKE